jgi:putative membrane protein
MSRSRSARALVLAFWSAFFAYLWVSDEMVRYLGPRTYWVVPFGCITLGAAAVAQLASAWREGKRGGTPGGMSRDDVIGVAALLVPIVAVIAVPSAELGALAASRKAPGAGATSALLAPSAAQQGRPPSFIDVHYANESAEYARSLGIGEGSELDLLGFVSEPSNDAGTFILTRFYVSCCAADAIPYSVKVTGDGTDYAGDVWLRVRGSLVYDGEEYRLAAESVEEVEEPDNQYLY